MASRRALGLRRAVARLTAPRPVPELTDGGTEEEEVGAAVAAAARALRDREKATRERRIRRLMEPPGPPERALTRQAMEQIRYLNQELPEEWSVARLAQGFQVAPDVIRRVLRSRFVPSPERAAKQDARALARVGLVAAGRTEGALPGGPTFRALVPLPAPSAQLPARLGPPAKAPKQLQPPQREPGCSEGEAELGQELSLEELEELAAEDWHKRHPPSAPVQRGWEFFDSEGNLLYKVPVGHLATGKDSP